MSWQAYVDDQLLPHGFCEAALVGLTGGNWAISKGLNVTAAEGTQLTQNFNDFNKFFASGINVGGVKYLVVKADARSAYGKKGAGGIICVKTGKCILVGVYDEKLQPGQAATIVEKLADYLISTGY
eukprot:gene4366-5101_t